MVENFRRVSKNSDIEVIKSAYRDLIKKYHPDNPDSGNEQQFLKIQEAYAKALKR